MRTARLLGECEYRAGAEAEREANPGAPRRAVAQHEIHGEQGEAGSRMGSRETGGASQVVRAVGEQRHIGKVATEGHEVPRAVDIGELLEQAGEAIRQRQRQHEIEQRPPPGRERCEPPGEQQREQRAKADRAHRVAAARMHDASGPECVAGEPATGSGIEVQPRHRKVEMQAGKQ